MNVLNLFFHFNESPENSIATVEDWDVFVKELINLLDRADCEWGSRLFIDSDNQTKFLENLSLLEDYLDFTGVFTASEAISLILQDINPEYWNQHPIHDEKENDVYYRQFEAQNMSLVDDCSALLKETAEKFASSNHEKNEKCLIIASDINFTPTNFVTIIRRCKNTCPSLVNVEVVKDFTSLETWIFENTRLKNYNYGDNRHCENHRDYRRGKSVLIGGQAGKQNAAELLKTALGDKRQIGYLINKDSVNDRYIRFEFESVNPQYQFHGFHLQRRESLEEDHKAISKIPKRLLRLLEYRSDLQK